MKARILASAGTGKTYQLTTRYLARIREQAAPKSILATTFTRKASGEILERVLTRLAEAALDSKRLAELGASMGEFAGPASTPVRGGQTPRQLVGLPAGPAETPEPLTQEECDALLAAVCGHLDQVAISTLDSFFLRLCRAFPFETDLPPGVRPEEPGSTVDQLLRRRALHATLEDPEAGVPLDDLLRGRATRGIFAELMGVVDEGYDLFRDSPPEAWQVRLAPPAPDEGAIGDALDALLSIAERKETGGHLRNAIRKDVERARAGEWSGLLGSGLVPPILRGDEFYRKPIPGEVRAAYEPVVARALAGPLEVVERQTRAAYEFLRGFDRHYQELLRRHQVLLFSEAPRALAGTEAIGDAGLVAYRMGASIEHLLLDEFQDTSPDQWAILLPFARHCVAPDGPGRSFFCVGDAKQAIYAFRGGTSEILARIPRVLGNVEEQLLDRSRRSSPVVLDAVNRVFEGIAANAAVPEPLRGAAAAWQGDFHSHEAHHAGLPGHVALVTSPAPQQAEEGGEDAEAPPDHLRFVAERIRQLAEGAPWAQVGVLMRTNAGVQRALDALRQAGVPASGEGAGRVDDDPAVELILSALTLADHPGHTTAALHVANAPVAFEPGVGPNLETDAQAVADLARRIRRRLLSEGYAQVIAGWAVALAPFGGERTAARLAQLVEVADAFQPLAGLRPGEFVSFARDTKVDDPVRARVRAMTIHASKGLEFDLVVLPELGGRIVGGRGSRFLVDQETPVDPVRAIYCSPESALCRLVEGLKRCLDLAARGDVRDGLCLLYVAMTRARYALHLFVEPAKPDPKGGLKPRSFTYAGVLCAALRTPGVEEAPEGGQALYENGDPDWSSG